MIMMTEMFLFPGDKIDSNILPSHPSSALKIGPGLRHVPPDSISPTIAGKLCIDNKKNAVWIEYKCSRVKYSLAHENLFLTLLTVYPCYW